MKYLPVVSIALDNYSIVIITNEALSANRGDFAFGIVLNSDYKMKTWAKMPATDLRKAFEDGKLLSFRQYDNEETYHEGEYRIKGGDFVLGQNSDFPIKSVVSAFRDKEIAGTKEKVLILLCYI